MEVMNSNVNATKDLMERDAKMSVPWNVEFMEVAQLKSMVLLALNSGNAFAEITLQVSTRIHQILTHKVCILGPECTIPCIITCNVCDQNPCQNGGMCKTSFQADSQECFIRAIEKFFIL